MLDVNAPANCDALLGDPPDAGAGPLVYSCEQCNVDRANNPTMLACGYQNAGLRLFDIRDPQHSQEIAYFKPPAVRKAVLPGSGQLGARHRSNRRQDIGLSAISYDTGRRHARARDADLVRQRRQTVFRSSALLMRSWRCTKSCPERRRLSKVLQASFSPR